MTQVEPIPARYPRLTPYLAVDDAAKAIDFYRDVFGAVELNRMAGPDGKILHAELELGSSMIMLADPMPGMSPPSPLDLGGSPVTLMVYVADVDDAFARAIAGGAKEVAPVADQFYGDRSGQFEDPFGHRWNVASHIEDVSEEEMERRAREAMGGGAAES